MSKIDDIILEASQDESWRNYKPKSKSRGSWLMSFRGKSKVHRQYDELKKIVRRLATSTQMSANEMHVWILQNPKIGCSLELVKQMLKELNGDTDIDVDSKSL